MAVFIKKDKCSSFGGLFFKIGRFGLDKMHKSEYIKIIVLTYREFCYTIQLSKNEISQQALFVYPQE